MSRNIWSPTDPVRERHRKGWVIALIVAVVLILVISGFLAYHNYTMPPTPSPSPKDEISALLPLSPATLYQTVMRQKPALQDPLNGDNAQAWDLYNQNGGGCQFKQQALHVFITDRAPIYFAACFLRNEFLTNFAVQVQITLGGATMFFEARDAGVFFRANQVHQVGYSSDIYTDFSPISNESELHFNMTLPDGSSKNLQNKSSKRLDAINAPHVLTLIALRNHFTVYIDGQSVIAVTNSTYQIGQLGFYAILVPPPGITSFPQFDDLFQNMRLWTFQ